MSGSSWRSSTSLAAGGLSPNWLVSVPDSVISPKPGCEWYERPTREHGVGFHITPSVADRSMPFTSSRLRPSAIEPLARTRSSVPSTLRARTSEMSDCTTLRAAPTPNRPSRVRQPAPSV